MDLHTSVANQGNEPMKNSDLKMPWKVTNLIKSPLRILENNPPFIAPQNPSAFDPNLNLVMANGGTLALNSQFGLPCDEAPEMKSWSSSVINDREIQNDFRRSRFFFHGDAYIEIEEDRNRRG
ncbi:hypothetical protein SUGI_1033760 [Cryptomeria japonica]|nr:hypothetical protein SUGI_1033760 [Cryptomeria japonica]